MAVGEHYSYPHRGPIVEPLASTFLNALWCRDTYFTRWAASDAILLARRR